MDKHTKQLARTMKRRNNPSARESLGRFNSRLLSLFLSLFVCLCTSTSILAQSDNAQISGFVKDSAGAVIPGAKVVVKSQTKSVERTAVTNDQGYYVISNLPPDTYSVTVEHPGFKRLTLADKKVDPNIATTVDVSLEVGQVSEVVSVVAQSAVCKQRQQQSESWLRATRFSCSMLNGRNPLFLALLKPGVSGGALGGFSFALTYRRFEHQRFSHPG